MRSPRNRLFLFGYALTLIVLVGDVLLTYLNISTLIEDLKIIQHTDAVQAELNDTVKALLNSETAQRGYILTAEEAYLEPYRTAVPKLSRSLERLDELYRNAPALTGEISKLKNLVAAKLADFDRTIAQRRNLKPGETITLADLDSGQKLMEELRAAVSKLEIEQRNEFAFRSNQVARGVNATTTTFALASSLVLLLLIAVTYFRRKFERRRLENENKFRSLADSAPVMVWMADTNGQSSWFNKGWLDFSGRKMEVEIADWTGRVHVSDAGTLFELRNAAFSARTPFTVEYRLCRSDGVYRWVFDTGTPVFGSDSKFEGFVGSCVDIHELKESEEQRKDLFEKERTARNEADRANRLKDEFLATLSHELRTPLNAILGYAQLLKRGSIPEAKRIDILEIIERNSRSQAQIIDDLLEMSRIISGRLRLDRKDVDLNQVVLAALESVGPSAEGRQITITKKFENELSMVWGDPMRLQQVVWNLLTNAIKFSPKGGSVSVVLHIRDTHVELIVTDSGIGITPDFLPYVFDRFKQADSSTTRRHGGLGLGLAIVKQIVDLHGGSVAAHSDGPNLGSVFTVTIPLSDGQCRILGAAETVKSPNADFVVDSDRLNGRKILVVDDETDSRDVVRQMLELSGATVLTADSARAGFDLLRSERPDVLLSDIGMPQEDGYQFISRIRALTESEGGSTPAVALTAFARDEDKKRALTCGYQVHLAKPVEPSRLVFVVGELCGPRAGA